MPLDAATGEKFAAIVKGDTPPVEQAKHFVKAFIEKYGEKMEEVMQHADRFAKLLKPGFNELEVNEAMQLLEKNGRPIDFASFSKILKEKIDLNANGRMSLVEFLLYWYNENAADFVSGFEKPRGTPEYLAALDAAAEVQKKRDEINAKKADLQRLIDEGGVKGAKATAELAQMNQHSDLELNKLEVAVQKALRHAIASNVDPLKEREKALAAEHDAKAKAEEEERQKKRDAVKEKTGQWSN